jgi:hypothetical protein
MPSDERVPYAFEKRVMAGIKTAPAHDAVALWSQALWRAVAPCLGVMAIAATVGLSQTDETDETEFDLDTAVLAPAESALDYTL